MQKQCFSHKLAVSMSNTEDFEKAYLANNYEDEIYAAWEKSGFFNPDNLSGEPFSLMMPPPNVTGVLHLGHALENTIMDSMIRYQRMRGKKAVLVPGTDHAAVATQARVEKNLVAQGIEHPREHYGREKLLEIIREYAENSKATILKQVKKMGTSADWSRLAYTFDEKRSSAVNEVFVRMYNDGLICRGTRLVNWSVGAQSVLSDDELEWEERQEPFYYIRCGKFIIGTVRAETKCANSPLVIHPEGQYVELGFTNKDGQDDSLIISKNLFDNKEELAQVTNELAAQSDFRVISTRTGSELAGQEFDFDTYAGRRHFKVVADEIIDMDKGTGAMTISANHSAEDYDMANRLHLDDLFFDKLDFAGKMLAVAGPLEGVDREEARAKAAEIMRQQGILVGTDDRYVHRVPLCYRTGTVIEPMVSRQWFVSVQKEIPGRGKSLKDLMIEAVKVGHNGDPNQKVIIKPDSFEKMYFHWIDNLRDWCISRQIWWGHRIPVWYKGEEMYCGQSAPEGEVWVQDEDTLDTWFSSGLWTFSILGWPEQTEDLKFFHPTSWMQMGYEILFFWLARMILMSTYALDQIPFKNVYIHGILRDKDGRKFSKSLGNGIDPIDVIQRYGADALRFSLIAGVSPGNDARFYEEKVESAQHLVNKLWNVSRYILTSVEEVKHGIAGTELEPKTLADIWILSRLEELERDVARHMEQYEFSQAAEKLRDFTWSQFADWYLEVSKAQRTDEATKYSTEQILVYVLEHLLTYWHPFMPFVTEVIWKHIDKDNMLIAHGWPQVPEGLRNIQAEKSFTQMQELVIAVRNTRSAYKVDLKKKIDVLVRAGSQDTLKRIENFKAVVCSLGGIGELVVTTDVLPTAGVVKTVVGENEIAVELSGLVDLEKERERLKQEIQETQKYLDSLNNKLSNTEFTDKAPSHVVQSMREKQVEASSKLGTLKEQLTAL